MKFCFVILSLAFCFIAKNSFAQSDTLNQKDTAGLKQGYWILYGKDLPEKNYCHTCKIEEGFFKDNRKNGNWIFYHKNGNLKTKANFVDGRPRGFYSKYYENGVLKETGNYTRGSSIGELCTYYENGCLQMQKHFDVNGKDSLPIIFYYPNCDTSISVYGSIKFKREKSPNGGTVDSTFYEDGTYMSHDSNHHPPSVVKTGDTLVVGQRDSQYKKVYNTNGDLWMDGEFKGSKLWNGKLYKYDSDGILRKIEIWKNGVYDSDLSDTDFFPSQSKVCCCSCVNNGRCSKHGELYFDGEVDGCCLLNGKVYYYDRDGILLKIEIWKNGVYHSDGQI